MQNVRILKSNLALILLASTSIFHKFHSMWGSTTEEMMLSFGRLSTRDEDPELDRRQWQWDWSYANLLPKSIYFVLRLQLISSFQILSGISFKIAFKEKRIIIKKFSQLVNHVNVEFCFVYNQNSLALSNPVIDSSLCVYVFFPLGDMLPYALLAMYNNCDVTRYSSKYNLNTHRSSFKSQVHVPTSL